jgi:hypothetical protein
MILSTLISNQATPTESVVGATPIAPIAPIAPVTNGPLVRQSPDHTSCRLQIDRVVTGIESSQERQLIGAVFQDLLRLLECLNLIESHLRQVDAAAETFALFQLIHDEARVLVDFIREDGLNCVARNEDLVDALDGITFAVNHDLQRVFENPNSAANKTRNSTPHVMLSKLYRAHDILTNCLQQSTITLAMMFDPELVGTKLFNDSDMRYRQSLQLCEDLSALIQLVETSEKESDESTLASLTAGLEAFRNESLECLMYSDWPQFESFSERIKLPATPATELEPVLHQFRCYLETLLGQVRMRAVLANVFPIQFGSGDDFHSTAAGNDNPMPLSPSFDFEEENSSWNRLAVAV